MEDPRHLLIFALFHGVLYVSCMSWPLLPVSKSRCHHWFGMALIGGRFAWIHIATTSPFFALAEVPSNSVLLVRKPERRSWWQTCSWLCSDAGVGLGTSLLVAQVSVMGPVELETIDLQIAR